MIQSLRLGTCTVIPGANEIRLGDDVRRVTTREMDVLMAMIDARGAVVSREYLLETVWNDVVVEPDACTLAVSRLRKALDDDAKDPRFIETIPTRGYRLLVSAGPADHEARHSVLKPGGARSRGGRLSIRMRVLVASLFVMLVLLILLLVRLSSIYDETRESLESVTAGETEMTAMYPGEIRTYALFGQGVVIPGRRVPGGSYSLSRSLGGTSFFANAEFCGHVEFIQGATFGA